MSRNPIYQPAGLGRFRLAQPGHYTYEGARFQPPTDVYETDQEIVVTIEVAGLQEEDYEISFSESDGMLTVAGRRQVPNTEPNRLTFHRLEIPSGTFATHVHLPWSLEPAESATARYVDGFLIVTLQKAKPRQVPVRVLGAEAGQSGGE
jgi:HSP20 family protein